MEGKITWQKAWDIDDLCSNFQLSFLSNVYLGQLHSPISLLSLGNRDSASHIFMRPSTSLHWTNSYFLQETCCLDEHVSSERKATSVPGKSPASSTPLLTRSLKVTHVLPSMPVRSAGVRAGPVYLWEATQAICISSLFFLLLTAHPAAGTSDILLIFLASHA